MRPALDTNLIVYAEGVERAVADGRKVKVSQALIGALADAGVAVVIASQTLAELHHVLVRRGRLPPRQASGVVREWADRADIVYGGASVLNDALGLAGDHGLQIFDALILAAAAEARCDLLLSEDFQDGFVWRGVTVTNPFGVAPDPRLARFLAPLKNS